MKTYARFLFFFSFALLAIFSTVPAFPQSHSDADPSGIVFRVDKLPEKHTPFPEGVMSFFLAADEVTLYSMEPDQKGNEDFHGYEVLGKASIKQNRDCCHPRGLESIAE